MSLPRPKKTVKREETEEGVVRWIQYGDEDETGAYCSRKVREWGAHKEIQFCPQCGRSYSKHSPAWGCFGCAVGLR